MDIYTNIQALDVTTPIWTTHGWKSHGDLRIGDFAFSPRGNPVAVIANTGAISCSDCYAIGGIVATGDHLWPHQKKIRRRTEDGKRSVDYVLTLINTRSDAIRLPHIDALYGGTVRGISSYVLGAWLGDGNSDGGNITCAYTDRQIIDEIKSEGYPVQERKSSNSKSGLFSIDVGIRGKRGTGFTSILRECGLKNNKHIPKSYLLASREQRLQLLQGLMDTDGTVNDRGTATFVNTNQDIVDGVLFLIRSLGIRASKRKYVGFWQVSFQAYRDIPVFRLKRKLNRCKTGHRVMRTYKPFPVAISTVNCIQVKGGFYLAGEELLPTHDSAIIA